MEDMDPLQQAALMLISASPKGILNSDLRIQKLAFLYSKTVGDSDLDEDFDFVPYDLGPYSENLVSAIELLGAQGLLTRDPHRNQYKTSRIGEEVAAEIAKKEPNHAEVARRIVTYLGPVDPDDLVAVVYELYPEYAKNSIIAERMKKRKSVDSLVVPLGEPGRRQKITMKSRLGKQVVISILGNELQIEETEKH